MAAGEPAVEAGATVDEAGRPAPRAVTRTSAPGSTLGAVPLDVPVDPGRVPGVELDTVRLLRLVLTPTHLPRHLRFGIGGAGPSFSRGP